MGLQKPIFFIIFHSMEIVIGIATVLCVALCVWLQDQHNIIKFTSVFGLVALCMGIVIYQHNNEVKLKEEKYAKYHFEPTSRSIFSKDPENMKVKVVISVENRGVEHEATLSLKGKDFTKTDLAETNEALNDITFNLINESTK